MLIDFYKTRQFDSLISELQDCINDSDVDGAMDIICDIEDAKKDHEISLPSYVGVRWSDEYISNPSRFKLCHDKYFNHITKEE